MGQRLSNPVTLCHAKRFSRTRFCKAAGRVSWSVGKKMVEKMYGMPPGSLDTAEALLNTTGKAPKGTPPDVVAFLKARTREPTWWEKFTDWLMGRT